jgi:hypothetical protein
MFLRDHTGFQPYPLTAGSNDAPQPAAGSPTTFELRALPIKLGNLAYYLYGITVTVVLSITQSGGTGTAINYDRLHGLIIDSVELRNAWHGTPISQNHVKGVHLPILSYLGAGYGAVNRTQAAIPAANGTYTTRLTFFVPLCMGTGDKPHHTAQLALFYKQSQLVLNFAASSVLAAYSTGATAAFTSVKATASILPEKEVRLGCGVENVLYRSPAASSQEQILLASFGNVTGLTGTIPDAGVLSLWALTNYNGQGGSFAAQDVTRYSFPWRGQVPITHIESILAQQFAAAGISAQGAMVNDVQGSIAGFPYALGVTHHADANPATGLLVFPMVTEANDVELTKVQTASGDQSYFLSGPTFSGENLTLARHVRSWQDSKREDAVKQIVDSGIAKDVIGQQTDLGWSLKLTGHNAEIAANKTRYLPWKLVPRAPRPTKSLAAAAGGKRG